MIFQIFLLDVKGKVLISRNYRGEIDSNVVDKFMPLLMSQGELIVGDNLSVDNVNAIVIAPQRRKA